LEQPPTTTVDPDVAPDQHSGPDPAADGQRALLIVLFNKYRGALQRHVERMVHSREDAAELVQETYLRVMRQVQTSRFEAAARAYLFQTATNLARDHHRRMRFRAHDRLDELPEGDLPIGSPAAEQTVAADQVLSLLRTAIVELPPSARAVFLRARVRNESYAEIGRELGMSVRTVERRMAEAMTILCARLRDAP
jgi:RNA polymerase sigma-70 factor (ECF subfamily)